MKRILIIVSLLFFFLTPTSIYAADSLTLCVKESGVIFAIGSGFHTTDCKKNDKVVTLTLGGSSGNGPTGATGEIGAIGLQGSTGGTGPKGDQGAIGETGPTGLEGPRGATGEIGATGPSGVGETGASGLDGPTGATGQQGNAGVTGVSGYERILGTMSADDELQKIVTADCNSSDKKIIGGGFLTDNRSNSGKIAIAFNGPIGDDTWQVIAGVNSTTSGDESFSIQAVAICATTL